jgi:MarR family transcriptional regulator, organic hydroperoxide resistance regulator
MSTDIQGTSAGPTTLDAQLCFALHDASRAIAASFRRGLAPLGLTYSQYVVLLVLWENGSTTMGRLCRELHLDSGTLSPLLQRLEERGRVVRRRRPEDERTVEVTCTPEGDALREPVLAIQRRVAGETGLDMPAIDRLRTELQTLADRLRTADESGVTGGD